MLAEGSPGFEPGDDGGDWLGNDGAVVVSPETDGAVGWADGATFFSLPEEAAGFPLSRFPLVTPPETVVAACLLMVEVFA